MIGYGQDGNTSTDGGHQKWWIESSSWNGERVVYNACKTSGARFVVAISRPKWREICREDEASLVGSFTPRSPRLADRGVLREGAPDAPSIHKGAGNVYSATAPSLRRAHWDGNENANHAELNNLQNNNLEFLTFFDSEIP